MREHKHRIVESGTAEADTRGMRIGILIVAYNAVGTLVQVLKRIPADVWSNIEEVAVFDDASADSTYELAVGYKTIAEAYKLHVFKHPKNLGYGGNQKAGYKYFINKGFDAVVLLHGDGQYAPEILYELYAPIVAGNADAVFGSRMMLERGGALRGGMPLYKYIGNRILSTYENKALGLNLSEFHSGYRAYNLHALQKIDMSAMTDDFHFDTEIIIKLHHQGFRIREVPIPTYYGDEICYVNGMKYAFNVVKAVRRYKATIRSARRYPEFREYFINYPLKESSYSSHGIVQRVVGRDRRVLDIGCGEGFFADALRRDGNEVVGVDVIPAPRLREAFSEYLCANLNDGLEHATKRLTNRKFDKILMMDVLQQLPSPERVLRDAASLMEPNCEVVVSLPNVANITVRLAMMFGVFRYSDRGILDRRHLRFFTRKTARELLSSNGYDVLKEYASVMPLEFVLDLDPKSRLARALTRAIAFFTSIVPNLLAYQWIFVARPEKGRGF
jgi:2-polyprenyl-3-methyl-5-hydroxy-6-metoxy-1,4-benzoquinol methylase